MAHVVCVTVLLLLALGANLHIAHGQQAAATVANAPASITAYGCAGSSAWIECPANHAISIIKATWGRTSLNVCKHVTAKSQTCVQTAADVTSSTTKVSNLCNDRRSCSIHAVGWYYGTDPCPGNDKYVTVEYRCTAPVCKNVETDSKCLDWATGDWSKKYGTECLNNPVFMAQQCWKACTDCNADCPNSYFDDAQCDSWALAGECDRNPKYMFGYCQRSCKACSPDHSVCRNALDDDRKCIDWAIRGECYSNKDWMYRNCRKACGACVKGCGDIYYNVTQCREWAARGDCAKNPNWMLTYCTQSCNYCPTVTGGCNNKHISQIDCEGWRKMGECSNNAPWMLLNCQKSCLCFKGDGTECLNAHRVDWACDAYAKDGKCDNNPGWMIPNCKRSCNRCT